MSTVYPKDILGVEIKPGCYIVYALRTGNVAEMAIGKVLEASETVNVGWDYLETITQNIKIIGVKLNYNNKLVFNDKVSNLSYGNRICVIDRIPDKIKEIFHQKS